MLSIRKIFSFINGILTLEEAGFINTRRLIRFFLFTLVFFAFVFGSTFVFLIRSFDEVQLADVVNQDAITAIKTLQNQKLKTYIVTKSSTKYERFRVIKQKPSAGTSIKQNRTIILTVSLGQKISKMPSFVGKKIYEAKEKLLDLFSAYAIVPNVIEQRRYSSDTAEGFIIEQQPKKGSPLDPDGDVLFIVSRGITSNAIKIISYRWENYKEVKSRLESVGIDVKARSVFTIDPQRIGLIFDQSIPPGGKLKKGNSIQFKVGIRTELDETIFKSEVYRIYSLQVPYKYSASLNRSRRNIKEKKITQDEINKSRARLRLIEVIVKDELGQSTRFRERVYVGTYLDIPYKTYGEGSATVYIDGSVYASTDF